MTTDSRIQLEQRDAQIQQQEAQLQEKDIQIHHNVAELGQIRALCNQRDSELTGIQQRLEVASLLYEILLVVLGGGGRGRYPRAPLPPPPPPNEI